MRTMDIGLVNNMPDSALKGTERQFVSLLESAAGGWVVRLHLFTLPEIARSDRGRQHLDDSYGSLGDLLSSRLDALIVTGAEPQAARLRDEPYWRSLTAVFDWAANNRVPTMLSCLAAHAAVLHFDGIEREKLPRKCLGVFDHALTCRDMLTQGGPAAWRVPHSRWNGLSETTLEAAGYSVLTRSDQAGVELFTKRIGGLFVFLQGHPEYERDTLLKEYQRDIRRFLSGERDSYPTMPRGYFSPDSETLLARFGTEAAARGAAEALADFPAEILAQQPATPEWAASARCIYGNWLRHVAAEQAERVLELQPA